MRVCLLENHDRAAAAWAEAHAVDRVLVHVDPHHDMWWTPDTSPPSIANFVCLALQARRFREVWWVVPDATWRTRDGRATIRRHLHALRRQYPGQRTPVETTTRHIRTRFLGVPLIVSGLDALPRFDEPVLLDIDTDFLMIPRVSYGRTDTHSALPWCWPDELITRLEARCPNASLVTVATSVEGGYTPIGWRYLAAEIAARARGCPADDEAQYILMRRAAEARTRGDTTTSEQCYRKVGDGSGGAAHFNLAYLLASAGRIEDARRHYDRSVELDAAYAGPFASPGVTQYLARAYSDAERSFEHTLRLVPDDSYARLGVGLVAAARRRWDVAGAAARDALSRAPDMIDAHRLLARALASQGKVLDAIASYERSLVLALAGGRTWEAIVTSDPTACRIVDAEHATTHARLARLHARSGDARRAAVGFAMAIAGGFDTPRARFALASSLARQHKWKGAWQHATAGARRSPAALARWTRGRLASSTRR